MNKRVREVLAAQGGYGAGELAAREAVFTLFLVRSLPAVRPTLDAFPLFCWLLSWCLPGPEQTRKAVTLGLAPWFSH